MVALDFPSLWSHHFMVSLRWTEELLIRSRQTSLKVYLTSFNPDTRWLRPVERLMNYAEHIQEPSLRILSKSVHDVLSKFPSSPDAFALIPSVLARRFYPKDQELSGPVICSLAIESPE